MASLDWFYGKPFPAQNCVYKDYLNRFFVPPDYILRKGLKIDPVEWCRKVNDGCLLLVVMNQVIYLPTKFT